VDAHLNPALCHLCLQNSHPSALSVATLPCWTCLHTTLHHHAARASDFCLNPAPALCLHSAGFGCFCLALSTSKHHTSARLQAPLHGHLFCAGVAFCWADTPTAGLTGRVPACNALLIFSTVGPLVFFYHALCHTEHIYENMYSLQKKHS